jgi:hypothetical protein
MVWSNWAHLTRIIQSWSTRRLAALDWQLSKLWVAGTSFRLFSCLFGVKVKSIVDSPGSITQIAAHRARAIATIGSPGKVQMLQDRMGLSAEQIIVRRANGVGFAEQVQERDSMRCCKAPCLHQHEPTRTHIHTHTFALTCWCHIGAARRIVEAGWPRSGRARHRHGLVTGPFLPACLRQARTRGAPCCLRRRCYDSCWRQVRSLMRVVDGFVHAVRDLERVAHGMVCVC